MEANRAEIYQEILIQRIQKAEPTYTYKELKQKPIDEIEMMLYDKKLSTFISDEEYENFKK